MRIALADGTYRAVEDLSPGDMLLTVNEGTYRLEAKPVLSLHDNGVKETVRLYTASRSLSVTPNHPVLANNRWTMARDIKPGDLLGVPKRTVFGGQDASQAEIDFLAIWLAEGAGYVLSNTTPEILDAARAALAPWGLILRKLSGADWGISDGKGSGQRRASERNQARVWLEEQGLWGKNSKTKFIPAWVYRLPRAQLARFLNLFMACDGSISRRANRTWAVEIGLASEHLVRQFGELFLKFGIRGQIRQKRHNKLDRRGVPYESWRFIVSDASALKVFASEIGALAKDCQVAAMLAAAEASAGSCNAYLPIGYADIVPLGLFYVPQAVRFRQQKDVVDRAVPSLLKGLLNSWRKQTPERVSVRRFGQLRPWLSEAFAPIADGDLAWEEVIGVEAGPEQQTWDLSLADNHNFFAENICVHNTLLCETIACDAAINGEIIGWFAPEYKFLSEAYSDIVEMLAPAIWRSSRMDGVIRLSTGGRIDFWSLDNPLAGRSRHYHKVIIDEAAFCKPDMVDVWRKAIEPTLLDYVGSAIAASNTNGLDANNFFYQLCNDPRWGFAEYWAPSRNNPFLPQAEIDALQARTNPLIFEQEYEAKFVDFSGHAFFPLTSLLVNERPVAPPANCDGVFAVIDTAIKDKSEHDGTGVVFAAVDQFGTSGQTHQLTLLDYDLIHIEGSLLEAWLPSVFERLEEWARACRARYGSVGVWIEDKGSGTILLQQAGRRGWRAQAIESKLTDLGKDARAISVSGYVHQGKVKLSETAYDRQLIFREVHRNHLIAQVTGYRVGIDSGMDDLLDCFCYSVAIALGDRAGF